MPISKEVHRVARPIPIVGQLVTLSRTRETLNEKGALYGSLDIALDLLPGVGRLKGLFELFGGDVVNRPNIKRGFTTIRSALDQIESFCDKFESSSADSSNQYSNTAAEEPASYPPSYNEQVENHQSEINNLSVADAPNGPDSTPTQSEVPEKEERYFPANSAKLAALRTKRALKPVQERRDFPNH